MFNPDKIAPYKRKQSQFEQIAANNCLTLPPSVGRTFRSEPITIRLADEAGERSRATMLINRRYESRRMGGNHKLPGAALSVSFTASTPQAGILGTISLTADGPTGLQTDKTFKSELDELRAVPGTRLCELTKLAFDMNGQSLPVLAALFHIILVFGVERFGGTDLVIEVSQRHRRFYEAMLNFKTVGEPRTNSSVGIETSLLVLSVADIRRYVDLYAGKPTLRSLYPYFFSKKEEEGLYNRIVNMGFDRGSTEMKPNLGEPIAAYG